MERAPLNQAHFHGRKADNHLKYLRFDEAIVSHQKAADCLQEVIETTTISSALQSLRLQRDYHLKRKDYSKMKKQQYACHALSAQMQETIQGQLFHELSKEQMKTCRELQMCIFTTMESADNLLETLYQRNEFAGGIVPRFDSYITTEQASGELSENAQQQHIDAMNVKHAEDCKVIDALRDTNHHLHRMVYRIVERLDENVQQGDALRKEIDTLKKLNAELQAPQNVNPVDGDVGGDAGNDGADGDREEAADAAVEVMQQDDNDIRDDELMMMIVESNPDNLEEEGAPEGGLPLLAPLELPTFNYDTLGGSDSDTA